MIKLTLLDEQTDLLLTNESTACRQQGAGMLPLPASARCCREITPSLASGRTEFSQPWIYKVFDHIQSSRPSVWFLHCGLQIIRNYKTKKKKNRRCLNVNSHTLRQNDWIEKLIVQLIHFFISFVFVHVNV